MKTAIAAHSRFAALFAIAVANVAAPPAARAETHQTCAGFIDSLPATISTQGTWCLRSDLATAINTGAAITVAANNVTIDCNSFKLGGLAAGDATRATGISATSRLNTTVRNCAIRGFHFGVMLVGGGHAVLDSRFDQNTHVAVFVNGDGSVVQRNRVLDTGGSTDQTYLYSPSAAGLWLEGDMDVLDNSIHTVAASAGRGAYAYGILHYVNHGMIARNSISGVQGDGDGLAFGISGGMSPGRVSVRDNHVSAGLQSAVNGTGLKCSGDKTVLIGNVVSGFSTGTQYCIDGGGNHYLP